MLELLDHKAVCVCVCVCVCDVYIHIHITDSKWGIAQIWIHFDFE